MNKRLKIDNTIKREDVKTTEDFKAWLDQEEKNAAIMREKSRKKAKWEIRITNTIASVFAFGSLGSVVFMPLIADAFEAPVTTHHNCVLNGVMENASPDQVFTTCGNFDISTDLVGNVKFDQKYDLSTQGSKVVGVVNTTNKSDHGN